MKKAVIKSSGQQFIIQAGQIINIDLRSDAKNGDKIEFDCLAIIDGDNSEFGTPTLSSKIKAEIVNARELGDKIRVMKFKAKKRQRTLTGHRQKYTQVKISEF